MNNIVGVAEIETRRMRELLINRLYLIHDIKIQITRIGNF